MNVKDFLIRVFMTVLLISAFTSCSDDDEAEPTPPVSSPYAVGMYVSVDISSDILAAADVYLQYIDGSGQQQLEKVTETSIRKTVVTDDFSQVMGYRVLLKEKAVYDISTASVNVAHSDYTLFAVVDKEGNAISQKQEGASSTKQISKEKLSDWITKFAVLKTVAYKVSSDKKNFEATTFKWADVK